MIAGGTGLIGTELTRLLVATGNEVIVLTRKARPARDGISYSVWDPQKGQIDPVQLAKADHIIHLAGAGVGDKRWTVKRKEEIVSSRIASSELLVDALRRVDNKVQSVVTASATGWYGPDPKGSKRPFRETDPAYRDFLGDTCRLWEESLHPVTELGKRLVVLRTGMVLSTAGGAFPEFIKPMKTGVAAILGGGAQMISWIHLEDICRIYAAAIGDAHMEGIYNAVAPHPVTNRELVLTAARARKKPFIALYVPSFALKLYLGEMSIEVLKSVNVDSAKLRATGFRFLYPDIMSAVNQLLKEG